MTTSSHKQGISWKSPKYIYIYIYIYIYMGAARFPGSRNIYHIIIYIYMWQGPFGIMRPASFLILSSGCSSFPSSSFSFLTCSSMLSQCFLHPHYSCYLWVLLGPKILLASHVFQFVSLFSQFVLPFLTPFYFPTHSTLSVAVSV